VFESLKLNEMLEKSGFPAFFDVGSLVFKNLTYKFAALNLF